MPRDLPQHVEEAIAEVEAKATAEVREALGRDDVVVEFDRTPLLIPEKIEPIKEQEDHFGPGEPLYDETVELLMKPIRKWPDDFRGFGSNVAPKKRRKS